MRISAEATTNFDIQDVNRDIEKAVSSHLVK
ncbi:hypothetical protein M2092_002378 [Fusobacterium sp. PH5-44]